MSWALASVRDPHVQRCVPGFVLSRGAAARIVRDTRAAPARPARASDGCNGPSASTPINGQCCTDPP
eukprot:COSAG02_NODE_13_length_57813_cov_14.298276_26_plen_67_part_00